MEIIIDKSKKLAEVWMSHADQENPEKQNKLKEFMSDCRSKKIFVCVFESGDGDLAENTRDLLAYNCQNPVSKPKSRGDAR